MKLFSSVLKSFLVVSLLCTTAVFADVTEEERFETTVSLGASGMVSVEASNGGIEVDTWSGDEVRIIAKKKARAGSSSAALELLDQTEIDIDESTGRVSITAREARTSGFWNRGGVTVSFQITIPEDARFEGETNNGSIKVRGLGASAAVETDNGSLTIEGVRGKLDARTTNGSIKAYDIQGAINAETTNGSIKAELDVMNLREDLNLGTTNGSVELRVNPGMSASIDARTHNGSVSSEFEGGVQDKRKKTLELELNGGGPHIELRSTNGSIRVREL